MLSVSQRDKKKYTDIPLKHLKIILTTFSNHRTPTNIFVNHVIQLIYIYQVTSALLQ